MHRGKLVIVTIVTVAILMAGAAWWSRYQQGRRAMQLWGAEEARLIRHAPRVELLTFSDDELSGGESGSLLVEGRQLRVSKLQDISHTRGLVHARHCLIEDASFEWQSASDKDCTPKWTCALRFSDQKQAVTLVLDLNCGQALLLEKDAKAYLVERIRVALAKYIEDHFR